MTVAGEARNFTASITILDADQNAIGGPFDVSEAVSAWKVDFAGLNLSGPNGYRPWTGELFLEDGIISENIDVWDTTASPAGASLLSPGNEIDLRVWDGAAYARSWPTLYILRVPSLFDPLSSGDRSVSIELGDITQLKNLRSPETKLSRTMTLGTSTTRSTIANAALSDAGLSTSADVITKYPLSSPPQKFSQGSIPNEVGRLVGTAGYNFWVDSTDAVRFTAIDIDKSAPDFTLTIGVDEFGPDGWVRKNLAERPPAKLIVTAAGGLATEIDNPLLIEDIQAEYEYHYSFEISGETTTEIEEERLSRRRLLPEVVTATDVADANVNAFIENQQGFDTYLSHRVVDEDPLDGQTTVEVTSRNTSTTKETDWIKTTTREYSRIRKDLVSESFSHRAARASAGGDVLRREDIIDSESNAYDLIDVEVTNTDYKTKDGVLSEASSRSQKPWGLIRWQVKPNNYELNRLTTFEHLTQTITWERIPGNIVNSTTGSTKRWQRTTRIRRYQGEDPVYVGSPINAASIDDWIPGSGKITSDENGKASPPKTEYLPSVYEQSDEQYSGEVDITPLAGNAHKNAEETVAIQGPYGVRNAQCDELAQLIARLRHGLNLSQQFIGAIPAWILSSFSPNPRVDITDNGIIRSYALNGWSITADAESTLWGATFARLGDVGVTPDVVTPPVQLERSGAAVSGEVEGSFAVLGSTLINALSGEVEGSLGSTVQTIVVSGVSGEVEGSLATLQSTFLNGVSGEVEGSLATLQDTGIAGVSGEVEGSLATLVQTDPDITAWLAAASGTYTTAQQNGLHAFAIALKAAGTWSTYDHLKILFATNINDTLINLIDATSSGSNNGLTFVAGDGMAGDGSSAYYDTGFNPSTAGGNYTQNSAHMALLIADNTAIDGYDMSVRQPSSNTSYIASRFTTNDHFGKLNSGSGFTTSSVTDSRGLWTVSRTSANLMTMYQDTSSLATNTQASVAMPNSTIKIGGLDLNGAMSNFADRKYRLYKIGGGLTAGQISDEKTAIDNLLTAFGL